MRTTSDEQGDRFFVIKRTVAVFPFLVRATDQAVPFAQGTKGTGGAIIILEEAARIDPALFKETVVPLLLVEHTALIGASANL